MSGTKWTNEQWDAITVRDCNLLVAAAAGAGKTAVLVQRTINKITDEQNPVDIDRLLIVTFTNAAATEMRERIADAISKLLEKNPDSRFIQRQLILLGKASITTLHSFCTDVIRSNFQTIDIDPNFRISDETESTLLKLEALNDLFEEQYEKEDNQVFFDLLESYGSNRGDERLMDMVLELYTFVQSSPWPQEWLNNMANRLNIVQGTDFGATVWGRFLFSTIKLELEGMRNMMTHAHNTVKSAYGLEKYIEVFEEELAYIEDLLSLVGNSECNGAWDKLYYALNNMDFRRLPRCSKDCDKVKQELVKKSRDDMKEQLKKLRDKVVTGPSNEVTTDLKKLYPQMKCLTDLVIGLTQKYTEKKAHRQILDFNDLEHTCLKILTVREENGDIKPSDIALNYRERFEEIMVDEYQDSNLVQEIIINTISKIDEKKPNIFMVGDVKQSIYRFRQARPELFLEKYNSYDMDKESPFRKILLYKNFRSHKNVVEAINYIFNQVMSVNVGELDYSEAEKLNVGALYPDDFADDMVVSQNAEIHLVQTQNEQDNFDGKSYESETDFKTNDDAEEEILDNIQLEARIVAKRIHELMKPDINGKYFSIFDKTKKEYRKVEYKDIVILLRTTRNWSDVFVEEFASYGIPSFADTGSGFFKTIEVQVILSLLQVIDNPLQDIPLLAVLRSPIVELTTDELAQMRLMERKGSIYYALRKYAQQEGEGSTKAREFLQKLFEWRKISFYLPTDELIWRLYNETGYYTFVGAMPAGEQRQANLRILFERASQFEETSYKGLFNFINFIDKLKSSKGDMGSAKILSENDNVVRIMSIHKSKGLEFPVVFLSGCGKKFNLQDMNKSILLHQDIGFGPDIVDYEMRLSYPSVAKLSIKEKIRRETLSEEMRILYVALTRAREKLIITGSCNNISKALDKWVSTASTNNTKLNDYDMLKAGNYLDWICPALIRHFNCSTLRDNASIDEFEGCLIKDSSKWEIKLWNKKDVIFSVEQEKEADYSLKEWLNCVSDKHLNEQQEDYLVNMTEHELMDEIDRRLNWEYGYSLISNIPAQVSVTELKRRFDFHNADESSPLPYNSPSLIKKPMFLQDVKGLSGAEKGTIMHFVMQHLSLDSIIDKYINIQRKGQNDVKHNLIKDEITRQIKGMIAKDLLTTQQADSIEVGKIYTFFNSEIGQRMLMSDSISREVPFNIEIPLNRLYNDIPSEICQGEAALLQGVIDCYFEEPDGIVLIDYKTDYVALGNEETIKENYKSQIDCYTRALESLTCKNVKEKYIYLFYNGKLIRY